MRTLTRTLKQEAEKTVSTTRVNVQDAMQELRANKNCCAACDFGKVVASGENKPITIEDIIICAFARGYEEGAKSENLNLRREIVESIIRELT